MSGRPVQRQDRCVSVIRAARVRVPRDVLREAVTEKVVQTLALASKRLTADHDQEVHDRNTDHSF